MEKRVKDTINEYKMIENGDTIAIGVSGGADSVALLHFLDSLKEQYNLQLIVCHMDHMIRGEESFRDAEFVRELSTKLNLRCEVHRVNVPELSSKRHETMEEAARNERYRFFKSVALDNNGKIATAHTLSDSMETILFNIARGTGTNGLCGIRPVRENIIRPLIFCTRMEIENYMNKNNLTYIEDSTNKDNTYTRNRIRNTIIPKLYDINPSLNESMLRMIKQNLELKSYLSGEIAAAYSAANDGSKGMNVKVLLTLSHCIRKKVLVKYLKSHAMPVDALHIDMINDAIEGNGGKIEVTGGKYAVIGKKYFRIESEEKSVPYFEKEIGLGKNSVYEKHNIECTLKKYGEIVKCERKSKNDLKNSMDYDKIYGKLIARQRRNGDKIQIAHRNCTKTLKKLFSEEKLTKTERNKRIILSDDKGVVWVEGIGIDKRVAVNENTVRILEVESVL